MTYEIKRKKSRFNQVTLSFLFTRWETIRDHRKWNKISPILIFDTAHRIMHAQRSTPQKKKKSNEKKKKKLKAVRMTYEIKRKKSRFNQVTLSLLFTRWERIRDHRKWNKISPILIFDTAHRIMHAQRSTR